MQKFIRLLDIDDKKVKQEWLARIWRGEVQFGLDADNYLMDIDQHYPPKEHSGAMMLGGKLVDLQTLQGKRFSNFESIGRDDLFEILIMADSCGFARRLLNAVGDKFDLLADGYDRFSVEELKIIDRLAVAPAEKSETAEPVRRPGGNEGLAWDWLDENAEKYGVERGAVTVMYQDMSAALHLSSSDIAKTYAHRWRKSKRNGER